jgi:ADP-ribose pyrophosphatase
MGGGCVGRVNGQRLYSGRILDVDVDRVRFPDGSIGELEIIRHPGASAVVPVVRFDGTNQPVVTLIRQYRYAAEGFMWEIPAGKLDPGETPEACARRELREETGLYGGLLDHLSTIHTTPGFTDEVIHLYVALDLESGMPSHEVSEFIEVHEFPLDFLLNLIDGGEISDAKTICALTLAARWLGRKKGIEQSK